MTPLKIEVAKVVVGPQLAIPSLVSSVVVKKQDVARTSLMAKIERGKAFVVSLRAPEPPVVVMSFARSPIPRAALPRGAKEFGS